MAKTRVHTWGIEILTVTDLNAEFDNFLTNPMDLVSPAVATLDLDGQDLIMDTNGDTKIAAGSDDVLVVTVAGSAVCTFRDGIVDLGGKRLDIDSDNDSSLRATADDIVALELQGFDTFIFDGDVASPVAGLTFTSAAEAGDVGITVQGSGTDAGLVLTTKGAGNLNLVPGTGTVHIDGGVLAGKCINATKSSWVVGSLPVETSSSTTVAATNAALGDFVLCAASVDLEEMTMTAYVSSSGIVEIVIQNTGTGVIDLGTIDVYVRVLTRA